MSKTTLSIPPAPPLAYGSVIQTTLGPLSISGSNTGHVPLNSGGPWTTNSSGPSNYSMTGPAGHMLWSSFRFDAKEWSPGSVARLFVTARGHSGQGHSCALTDYDTNLLSSGKLPIGVEIKGITWELRRPRPSGPLEELAQAAPEEPSCREESLMGLIGAASISLESSQTLFSGTLMCHDLPKGQFPWRNVEDWRGGLTWGRQVYSVPAGLSFAIRVDFLEYWRPIQPVSLRVILELA